MASSVSNEDTEACLRELLRKQGYALSPTRAHGETGVDVLATKDGEEWHIEVIGYKRSPPARAKDFYESFFRAVSRLNDGATHCVIALPAQFGTGLPARAAHHREAWGRIAEAFPELEIWLVDVENTKYQRTAWARWLE